MKNRKMTEIDEILCYKELEEIVNTIVKTMGRSLRDIETKILKGIYQRKTYPELAKEINNTEQTIKNTASSLFKILNASKLLKEEVNKSNFISVFQRYKINSQNNYKEAKSIKLILLKGEISKLDEATFKAIVKLLQRKGQDVTIEIINVEEGSIKITIQGTEEGLARIQELFDSENLETIEGFEVLEVRDLDEKEQKRLEDKSIREVDLREADLRGADLSTANLIEADLSGAYLSRADLSGADLSRADLSRADLIEADLIEADLSRANLRGADLSGADLSTADLSGAYLRGAYLIEADLSGADLIEADLSGAYLRGAYLRGANLSGANLIEADLSGAYLIEADLIEADLRGADLIEANLRGANLSGAYLSGASVKDARFTNTKGINPEQKDSLIERGAIFDDSPRNFSKVFT